MYLPTKGMLGRVQILISHSLSLVVEPEYLFGVTTQTLLSKELTRCENENLQEIQEIMVN